MDEKCPGAVLKYVWRMIKGNAKEAVLCTERFWEI